MKSYGSLEEFIADLPSLTASMKEVLAEKDETFCLQLEGRSPLYVNIRSGNLTVSGEAAMEPVTTVKAKEDLLLKLITGKISPMKALMFGGVSVSGSKQELLRFIKALS